MIKLSASRLKTLDVCSWLYKCQYVDNLPRFSNEGATLGTIVHLILECLLKKHASKVSPLIKGGVENVPSVKRLALKHLKKEGLPEEKLDFIDSCLKVALENDFFIKGFDLLDPEYKFDIKTDKYHILGFLDKGGIKDGVMQIWDYKTSKQKPGSAEQKFSIQGMMYCLAASHLWPQVKRTFVNFLYLRFKKNPLQVFSISKEKLEGFKAYLEYITDFLKDFGGDKATSNFAAKNPAKKMLCGTKEDRFKDDGSPAWRCPYMLPFEYYAVVKDGKNVRSSLTLEGLKAKEGENFEKKIYRGCPVYFKQNHD